MRIDVIEGTRMRGRLHQISKGEECGNVRMKKEKNEHAYLRGAL